MDETYPTKTNPNFNRFWLIHPCDRQTDRQTDGRATAYSTLSIFATMLSRAKNTIIGCVVKLTVCQKENEFIITPVTNNFCKVPHGGKYCSFKYKYKYN